MALTTTASLKQFNFGTDVVKGEFNGKSYAEHSRAARSRHVPVLRQLT